nr:hypothetical protein [Kitasatospora acidiphila]
MTTADTYVSVMPETAHDGAEATARLVQQASREYSRSIRYKSTARLRAADIRQAQRRKSA